MNGDEVKLWGVYYKEDPKNRCLIKEIDRYGNGEIRFHIDYQFEGSRFWKNQRCSLDSLNSYFPRYLEDSAEMDVGSIVRINSQKSEAYGQTGKIKSINQNDPGCLTVVCDSGSIIHGISRIDVLPVQNKSPFDESFWFDAVWKLRSGDVIWDGDNMRSLVLNAVGEDVMLISITFERTVGGSPFFMTRDNLLANLRECKKPSLGFEQRFVEDYKAKLGI